MGKSSKPTTPKELEGSCMLKKLYLQYRIALSHKLTCLCQLLNLLKGIIKLPKLVFVYSVGLSLVNHNQKLGEFVHN